MPVAAIVLAGCATPAPSVHTPLAVASATSSATSSATRPAPPSPPSQKTPAGPSPAASPSLRRPTRSPTATSAPAARTGAAVSAAAAAALRRAGSATYLAVHGGGAWLSRQDLQVSGSSSSGTEIYQGLRMRVITADGMRYAMAPAPFWADQGISLANSAKLASSWVQETQDIGSAHPGMLLELAATIEHPSRTRISRSIERTTFAGQRVIKVTREDGSFMLVAADGEPYPLFLKMADAEGTEITLSGFGRATVEPAPHVFITAEELPALQ